MAKKRENKKGDAPSKEDAESALDFIKKKEQEDDKEAQIKRKIEEDRKTREELERKEKERIAIAQDRVRRKLRENLQAKEEKEKMDKAIKTMETGGKINWKTTNSGGLLGYVENKLLFEITRGLSIYNLYVKDKDVMKKNNLKQSYISCSSTLPKLKSKSEKLI